MSPSASPRRRRPSPSDRRLRRIEAKVDQIHLEIAGDPQTKGMRERVRSLEQSRKRATAWLAGLWALIVSAVGGFLARNWTQ